MCILISEGHLIEYVYWWEFVCKLSETLHSLYSLCRTFWEWDEWPSLRSFGSLPIPSLRSLVTWLHSTLDLSGSLIHFVLFASLLSSFLFAIHSLHLTSYSFYSDPFQVWYFLCIIVTHLITSSIFFIVSSLILYPHWAPSGPWLTRFSIHVAFYRWGHGFWSLGIWA